MIPKIGDKVEILACISNLQPLIWEDKSIRSVKKTKKQYGEIVKIDGAYIDVRPKGCKWVAECWETDLRKISEKKYGEVNNYIRD